MCRVTPAAVLESKSMSLVAEKLTINVEVTNEFIYISNLRK